MNYFKSKDIPELSCIEIISIVKECKKDNYTNFEKLICFYLPKILSKGRFICRKYDTHKIQSGDLVVAGINGLRKSIQHFNTTKGIKFWTYASYRVDNEMSKEVFANMYPITTTKKRQALAKETEKFNNNTFITYNDSRFPVYEKENPYKICKRNDSRTHLKKYITKLPKREQDILIDRFHNSLTFSKIGEKNNITGAAIRQTMNKTLDKLKEEIKED